MILRKTTASYLATVGLLMMTGVVRGDEIPSKYRETVRKGLEFLAKSQAKDGHWGAENDSFPASMTGLAGLAMLMEGSTVCEGKYATNVCKAVDWLVGKSQKQGAANGLILSGDGHESGRYMFGHGFAMLFLACAHGDENDRARRARLEDVLVRGVNYIANAQSTDGGWYYTPGMNLHEGAVTVTQLQALRACRKAGIPVPAGALKKAADYLRRSTVNTGGVAYSLGMEIGKPVLTAAAIACSLHGSEYKNDLAKRWLRFCLSSVPVGGPDLRFGDDEYAQYYYAQVVYNLGDDGWDKLFGTRPGDARVTWSAYRTALFDSLEASQAADGSWTRGGFSVGPVYRTAVYCTIMQLDSGCLPFYERVY